MNFVCELLGANCFGVLVTICTHTVNCDRKNAVIEAIVENEYLIYNDNM